MYRTVLDRLSSTSTSASTSTRTSTSTSNSTSTSTLHYSAQQWSQGALRAMISVHFDAAPLAP